MTLVHSNIFDDFMLSLHDPMPPMPNEYHDSITTPVLVTELSDRREASILNDKVQQFNLTVNVFEIKLIENEQSTITSPSSESKGANSTIKGTVSKVNLQLKIEIGDQKAKTGRKSFKLSTTEQSVTFNETFTFDFRTVLSQFLDHVIEFRLLQSGRYIKGTKVLGKVDLDLISLYNEPGMTIKDHSLALFSELSSELVGYLKCDLIIDCTSVEKKETLLPVIRPVTPLSRHTPIESHLKSMNIMVNIYSGDMPLVKTRTKDKLVSRIRSRKTNGLCVTVTLGDLEGSTSSVKRLTSPIWNESITFHTTINVDKPPTMMIKVHDKSGSSTNFKTLTRSIDLSKISLDRGHGPIYGPSYLVVKETPKDHIFNENCLSGKLLISIRSTACDESPKGSNPSIDKSNLSSSNVSQSISEQLPSENQENSTDFNSEKQIKHSVTCCSVDNLAELNYPKEDEFTFFGVLYSSDMISKKLENRKLSYEVEIGPKMSSDRCGSPSILDLTLGSIVDTVIGSVSVDDKSSIPDKTNPARSTPIKGYNEQENTKITETSSILTSISKNSEKSERGSFGAGDTTITETNGKSANATPNDPSVTVSFKPEVIGDGDYLKLPLDNTKPLLGVEQMMIDTRSRSFVHNMIRRIREELEIGLTDVREMALIQHGDTFRRFRGVLEDLMVHCNRFLALTVMPSKYPKNELDLLYTKYRQRELIKLSADAKNTLINLNESNLSESLSIVTGYLGRIEDLLIDPQDDFPDIIIYLFADNKRIGYVRIPVADVIFSRLDNEKGQYCAKTSTYYIKSIKHPELILNRISLYTWFGLKRHKRHSTAGLTPGYEESLQLVFFQSLDGTLPAHLIYPTP